MGIFSFLFGRRQSRLAYIPKGPGVVSLQKGTTVGLTEDRSCYTVICRWDEKDRDLYLLVEYNDGHVEVVSCFGTMDQPQIFSIQTEDGAVVHFSGDQATTNHSNDELPQEVARIRFNPKIRAVAVVVYSAKNSGVGSFFEHTVSTYILAGIHDGIRPIPPRTKVWAYKATDANRDENVYTYVPVVITPSSVTAVELYSDRYSEMQPIIANGRIFMDEGPECAYKPSPNSM